MKQSILCVITLVLALMLTGCPKDPEEITSGKNPFNISDSVYSELTDTAYVQPGNNYRLKNVIEKLRNGQDVYIAALGGSVTEGQGPDNYTDGYFYQFCNKLAATYANGNSSKIHYVNAGLCGTHSSLGLIRYKTDVTDKLEHSPDLLIVEFAVNDDDGDQLTRAYEAIIRNALLESKDTAVIALHSAATYVSSAPTKIEVGKHYNIPQINILPAVTEAFSKNHFTQSQYYKDTVHPTKAGHEFMADCLMKLFDKTDKDTKADSYSVPDSWTRTPSKSFINFTRITGDDDNVQITAGAFSGTDANSQGHLNNTKAFPQNWYKTTGTNADEFVMKITCRGLILSYKQQGNWLSEKFGKAEIYVDGVKKETCDGGPEGGWNNCVTLFLIDDTKDKEHEVKIKMASGDENKAFTILAMGYSSSKQSGDPVTDDEKEDDEKEEDIYNVKEITKYASLFNSLAADNNFSACVWDLLDVMNLEKEKQGAGYMWRHKQEILFPSYVKAIIDAYPKSDDKGNSGDDSVFEEEDCWTAVKNFKAGWNLANSLDSNSYSYDKEKDNKVGWILQYNKDPAPSVWEKAWYEPVTTQEIADFVINAGFNTIRIPVTWAEHLDKDNNIDAAWMARVKEVVDYFYNRGVYCIVNIHHDGGSEGWIKACSENWTKYNGRFKKIWQQIAETFKDYDERLVFESMNEVLDGNKSWNPPDAETSGYINKFNQLFVDTVRESASENNKKRNLIVMTYAGGDYYDNFKVPTDTVKNHIILEVHNYSPASFTWTEKTASWVTHTALWSTSIENTIRDAFKTYKKQSERLGVPVFVGEYNASPKKYSDYDK